MRITTKGRYALRACLSMARLGSGEKPVSIRELSEKEALSQVFLEQIFFKLRKKGIVSSVRGPGGGFLFTRDISDITVREIMEAAEEDMALAPCGENAGHCANSNDCISHQVWQEATSLMNGYFEKITIGSLLEKYGNLSCGEQNNGNKNGN